MFIIMSSSNSNAAEDNGFLCELYFYERSALLTRKIDHTHICPAKSKLHCSKAASPPSKNPRTREISLLRQLMPEPLCGKLNPEVTLPCLMCATIFLSNESWCLGIKWRTGLSCSG